MLLNKDFAFISWGIKAKVDKKVKTLQLKIFTALFEMLSRPIAEFVESEKTRKNSKLREKWMKNIYNEMLILWDFPQMNIEIIANGVYFGSPFSS